MKRIEGCTHSVERMNEWIQQGACPICLTATAGELRQQINKLTVALNESIKLQSHYAELLNMHDGGQRMTFEGADAWIARLKETGTLKRPSQFRDAIKELDKSIGPGIVVCRGAGEELSDHYKEADRLNKADVERDAAKILTVGYDEECNPMMKDFGTPGSPVVTTTCCPECFSSSQDVNFGFGEVAVPESCLDEDCECHREGTKRWNTSGEMVGEL